LFTAKSTGQLPVVALALITANSEDVWQTGTLASDRIARSGITSGTENVAHARLAVLASGITVVTGTTTLAVVALRVVLALEALASQGIAAARHTWVNVPVAGARFARAARHQRVAEIVVGATVTTHAGVTGVTVTDDVTRTCVKSAGVSMLKAAAHSTRAHARSARIRRTGSWIAIVTIRTPLAVHASSVVATRQTTAIAVTLVRTSIALALPATRVTIVTTLALVALASECVGDASALPSCQIAETVARTQSTAAADCAAGRSEAP
jgi:hypothetical protein